MRWEKYRNGSGCVWNQVGQACHCCQPLEGGQLKEASGLSSGKEPSDDARGFFHVVLVVQVSCADLSLHKTSQAMARQGFFEFSQATKGHEGTNIFDIHHKIARVHSHLLVTTVFDSWSGSVSSSSTFTQYPTTFPKEASEEAQNLAKEATSKWGSPSGIGTDLFHFPAGSFFWCMVNLSFQFGFFGDESSMMWNKRSFELMMPSTYFLSLQQPFGLDRPLRLAYSERKVADYRSRVRELRFLWAVGWLNHLRFVISSVKWGCSCWQIAALGSKWETITGFTNESGAKMSLFERWSFTLSWECQKDMFFNLAVLGCTSRFCSPPFFLSSMKI